MEALRINTMLFPEGKRKALTLSYDDGVTQDRRMVKLLNQYGVKCTFNLNSGKFGKKDTIEANGKEIDGSIISAEEAANLYRGHEISTHTVHHVSLTSRGGNAMLELIEDRVFLESLVPYMVRGHAYAFGTYDSEIMELLKLAGICYARTVEPTHSFTLPTDFLKWDPTCHHNDDKLMELIQRFCEEDAMFGMPQIFYLWGHTYEFDLYDNWDRIEAFLSYVSGKKEIIWMATNIEIYEYIQAFQNLVYSADGSRVHNPSNIPIWLESTEKQYKIEPNETIKIG